MQNINKNLDEKTEENPAQASSDAIDAGERIAYTLTYAAAGAISAAGAQAYYTGTATLPTALAGAGASTIVATVTEKYIYNKIEEYADDVRNKLKVERGKDNEPKTEESKKEEPQNDENDN
jgi:hypothetical protein